MRKEQWSGCETNGRVDTVVWKEKPRKQVQLVRWIPPDENWIKLNVNGLYNAAGSGAGGILRDEGGNLIRGFKARISAFSQMDAELQAISLGLDLVRERGQSIWIEIGSPEPVALIRAEKFGAASFRHQVTEIRNKLKCLRHKISYIPCEGNKMASCLAQQGSKMNHRELFDQHTAAPLIKAMSRMDQLGLPNFQFR